MEQPLLFGLLFAIGQLLYAASAIGLAVLVFLWLPTLPRQSAALFASLPLPLILASFLVTLGVLERSSTEREVILAVFAIIAVPGVIVGWPCAALSLRALERRIERAGVTAKEIFE